MSKYFGEMSKEDFNEAIKTILAHKKETPKKKGFIDEIKETISKVFKAKQNFANFCSEPLNKEVFIRRGIKVKLFLQEVVETIVFVVVAMIIIRGVFGEIRWIPSGSMKPTLIEGDKVFISKMEMFKSSPKRGDIMVFYPPFEKLEYTPIKIFKRLTGFFCEDIAYIKRVVALPGEKFEIKKDEYGVFQVFIDDIPYHEPYVKDALHYSPLDECKYCGPLVLPKDTYMMLGDNRGNSTDSRYWGPLHKDKFIGKATQVFRFASLYQKNQYE